MATIKHTDEMASRQKMLIMLADDDQDDRSLFVEAFHQVRNMNTELMVFEDGIALLDKLQKNYPELPHIIFLDLNMPLKSGMEVLKELRQESKFSGISVAIYSTSNHQRDVEDAFSAGANVYIHKPNNFANLQKVLKHVLKMNWQFHLSGMNKETFFLNV